MRTARTKLLGLAVLLGAGTLFQAVPTSCLSYGTQLGLGVVNFCAILNCEGSAFFDLCDPPVLADCPPAATP
jgi:hypothetical protein